MEEFYTVKELSSKLKVSELTIRRYLESGKITGFKVGKVWRVSQLSIDKFILENTKTGGTDECIQSNKQG
jgi:excisionase family DNA binding protein